ncbi:alpha-(1,3)-fucosyltransferase C-like [Penaeus japonicus]|uniref:alpha-(1,3)-fucosyltransferase C-like n=1 Tax=Penaeus japonicus TaxID=27405 RepID=UPI001C70FF6C|nr:alpha-(1,3)-fucosyltransferase C-like [Penaeus japonicus]
MTPAPPSVFRALFRAGRRRGCALGLLLLVLVVWVPHKLHNVYGLRLQRELLHRRSTSEVPGIAYDVTSNELETPNDVISNELETPNDVTRKELETPSDVTSNDTETPSDVTSKKIKTLHVTSQKLKAPHHITSKTLKTLPKVTHKKLKTPHDVTSKKLTIPRDVTRKSIYKSNKVNSDKRHVQPKSAGAKFETLYGVLDGKLMNPVDVTREKSHNVSKSGNDVTGVSVGDVMKYGGFMTRSDSEGSNKENEKPEKIILLWKKFRRSITEWRHIFSRQRRGECEHTCRVVDDSAFLTRADAVVLRPSVRRLPPSRTPNQLWVAFSVEAPTHSEWDIAPRRRSLFNWTMNYHRGADVVMPFGRVVPRPLADRPGKRDYWSKKDFSRMAVWITSHCATTSRREDYVAALRRVLPVDVYGACGNLSSGTRDTIAHMPKSASSVLLGNSYMFYLAFENSICEDYVTEKFFKALTLDVVPVVLGGANYSAVAPPNSFVDTRDFASPALLGAHLLSIARNRSLYNSFFAWKSDYQIDIGFPFSPLVCGLCRKLHQSSGQKPRNYNNVERWFKEVSKCRPWERSAQGQSKSVDL